MSYSKIWGCFAIALTIAACAKSSNNTSNESAPQQGPTEPFPHFGTSASFAALSGKSITNIGNTTIYGDLGVSPGTQITGLTSVKRTGGDNHLTDTLATQAQKDSMTAYTNIKTKACDHDLSGQDLGGMTLTPGTYCFSGNATLNGILSLDAQGNVNANFIFQVAGSLLASDDSGINMLNNGETCDVFWQVGNTVNLGSGANIMGGIVAIGDITLQNNARLNGKLLSRSGAISLDSNEIYNNFCPWPGP